MKVYQLNSKSSLINNINKQKALKNKKLSKKRINILDDKPVNVSKFISSFANKSAILQLTNQPTYLANAEILSKFIAKEIEKQRSVRAIIKDIQAEWNKSRHHLPYLAGIKIQVSGRLNGVEMAQSYSFKQGQISLHTMDAAVDYSHNQAFTVYGVHGIKVWLSLGTSYRKKFFPIINT